MWDLKACIVCFSTGVKLYSLNSGTLRKDFNLVSGLQTVQGNGMPGFLCVECSEYVKKYNKFREKCHRAHYVLEQILKKNKEIRKSDLKALNLQLLQLTPSLSYIDLDRYHYEQVQFKLVRYSRTNVSQLNCIPVAHYSTLTKEETFEDEMKDLTNRDVVMQNVKVEIEQATNDYACDDEPSQDDDVPETLPSILRKALLNADTPPTLYQTVKANDDTPSTLITFRAKEESTHNEFNDEENDDSFEHNGHRNPDIDESDCENEQFGLMTCKLNNKVDGSSFNEEYGTIVPISVKEAKAVVAVQKYCSTGEFLCNCGKRFSSEICAKTHSRRHDMHISGPFHCEICDYNFKTEFLLQCHMTDQHMYKYLCKKCPEVSFSRPKAKSHYVWKHLQEGQKPSPNRWDGKKPSWLRKSGSRCKASASSKPKTQKTKKDKKVPKDFPVYTPIAQEEQYRLIQERKESRNYLEAKFKCEQCYRGYRLTSTYNKHMTKHDPIISGNHQCDMCKHYFRLKRTLYKHMMMYHLFKFSCRFCDFVCTCKGQALYHYRWHKNVTYDCPHCDKKFSKISTQLTHIRFKHPSTDICNLCGHSFVSSSGLNCHIKMSHTKEEKDMSEAMISNPTHTDFYCGECNIQFLNEQAYITHLGSSRTHVETNLSVAKQERTSRRTERMEAKGPGSSAPAPAPAAPRAPAAPPGGARGRPRAGGSEVLNTGTTTATNCEVCGKYLSSDVVARKHYEAEHPGTDYLKRYMCDVCGHTTKQYANLLVHMRVHTLEKPYGCPHCDRRFSMPSNRDRHLVVHTGEKRYQCHHCSRRFTQSTAVKLHIQTVHMKIPYKPWDKKNRKRRKEMEPNTAGLDMLAPPVGIGLPPAPQHKMMLDPQGESYISYISYADEQ